LATAQNQGKPADASTNKTSDKTIVEIAVEAGQFQTLVTAVKAAGLADTLSGKGPFTVFAPTDEAFAKLGKDTIANLLKPENKDKLTAILTYHVAGSSMPASQVVGAKSIPTLQGTAVAVAVGKDTVTVGGSKVLKTDIFGKNGVIHVIDTVMLPVDAKTDSIVTVATKNGSFTTLLQAAVAAGLADTLANGGPFTVFAPTDEAFAKLPKDTVTTLLKPENKDKLAKILKLHVVSGTVLSTEAVKLTSAKTLAGQDLTLAVKDGTLTVSGAHVVAKDVTAKNGVIHVIDTVILPRD
jgi:uncharacterized surface protein with fasciclin (FAS1) repeats